MFLFRSSTATTEAEKEQAAALKALIQERKAVLKQDLKQMDLDSKQELREAKEALKRQEHDIKMAVFLKMAERIQDEIASIQATDEYKNGDEKTKKGLVQTLSWIEWGLGWEAGKHQNGRCNFCAKTEQEKHVETDAPTEQSLDQKLDEIC